jgi:hypothetical protein
MHIRGLDVSGWGSSKSRNRTSFVAKGLLTALYLLYRDLSFIEKMMKEHKTAAGKRFPVGQEKIAIRFRKRTVGAHRCSEIFRGPGTYDSVPALSEGDRRPLIQETSYHPEPFAGKLFLFPRLIIDTKVLTERGHIACSLFHA